MYFEYFIVCLFGLVFGSFANACIYRLPLNLSMIPASMCPLCETPIKYRDNIPVLSYLFLKGISSCCQKKISIQYPVIEILAAILSILIFYKFGYSFNSASLFIFLLSLLILFMTDFNKFIIPNLITYSLSIFGFLLTIFNLNPFDISILDSFLGALICGGIFFSISKIYLLLRKIEGLGMGDIKMIGMLGFWLGIESTILIIIISSLLGSLVGISLILLNKLKYNQYVPYGTFISFSAFIIVYLKLGINFTLTEYLIF